MVTISNYFVIAFLITLIIATALTVMVGIAASGHGKWPWYAPIRIAIVAILYGAIWPATIVLTVACATNGRIREAFFSLILDESEPQVGHATTSVAVTTGPIALKPVQYTCMRHSKPIDHDGQCPGCARYGTRRTAAKSASEIAPQRSSSEHNASEGNDND